MFEQVHFDFLCLLFGGSFPSVCFVLFGCVSSSFILLYLIILCHILLSSPRRLLSNEIQEGNDTDGREVGKTWKEQKDEKPESGSIM